MDNNNASTNTPDRTPQPQTPRTPTRTGSSSFGRASSFSKVSSVGSSASNNNNGNASPIPSVRKSETDTNTTATTTTTPVYPESSVLKASAASNSKLQLSDIQPVNARTLERIKSLEISLEQHRDSERQFQRNIVSTQQDLARAEELHEQHMEAGKDQLWSLKRKIKELNAQSAKHNTRIQELWTLVQDLDEDCRAKEAKVAEIKDEYKELMEQRAKILQEREETEKDALEFVRVEKEKLQKEYVDIRNAKEAVSQKSEQKYKDFGPEMVQSLKERIQEGKERIAKLEAMVKEAKIALMEKENVADDLVLLFEKVYQRRVRSHTGDLVEKLEHAEKIERKRDQEANAVLEEYLRVNQRSIEAEEMASREEFSLLMEKEELGGLRLTLEALRMDLAQHQHTTLATT